MGNATLVTSLLIQMMPMLMREFRFRLDTDLVLADPGYAGEVIALSAGSASERLRSIGQQLEQALTPHAVDVELHHDGATKPPPPGRYVRSLR